MAVEYLTTEVSHARSVRGLGDLTTSDFARCINTYLLSCRVEGKSPQTLAIYGINLRAFYSFLPPNNSLLAEDITSNDVRLFLYSLQEKKRTPETVHCYYRGLKSFFNWLVAEGILSKSPMATIRPPKLPMKIIQPLEHEDIMNLLLLCSGNNFVEVRNRAIILIFLDTGLRLSELTDIRMGNVDFNTETIKVLGKGGKDRFVRMGRVAQKALLKYLLIRAVDDSHLWLTEERHPMAAKGIQTAVKRLMKRAQVSSTKRGPHTLRHTAAINCLRNGMGVFSLQIMLGHSSLEMTRRYVSSLGASDMCQAHEKASPVDNLGIK